MKKANISDAELEVMKELWNESPLTSRQLVDKLKAKTSWGDPTIKTLLLRLLRKKAVRRTASGKTFQYYAAIKRGEYQYSAGRSLLDRLFGGAAGNFLTCLVENQDLSAAEIAELRELLDRHEDARK